MAYIALACAVTWPLPLHLTTHFTGSPTGDLGVYVWNLWIFAHELVEHGRLPFSTDHVFAYTDGVDFSAHNYTPLAGLIGTPLLPLLGIVATFNVLLLAALVTSGLAVFALARRAGLPPGYAWIAGALFVASPVMTARETAHFSLVSAAALPLFAATLLRTFEAPRPRHGVAIGALVACALYSDAYYGVYCVLIGLFLLAWRFGRVAARPASPSGALRVVDGALAAVVSIVAWRVVSGTTVIAFGPVRIGFETLHNVMMALALLALVRLWLTYRPVARIADPQGELRPLVRIGAISVGVALVLLLPLMAGLFARYLDDRLPETVTYWRSSPRGVDLLAYVVPNPTHYWMGRVTGAWLLPPAADAFPEFTVAFPLVAWCAIAVALRRGQLPRMWVAFTTVFLLLSLGPFVHVGGVNTAVVGPWAFLRFVPLVGLARSPTRFAIVATIGLAILSAFAMRAVLETRSRRWAFGTVALLAAAVELMPIPRVLFAADVPQVYRLLATASDEQGRVLELPTGIRDGTSSVGDFNASSQFFQTLHHRPLIGGYVSRITERRKRENRRAPILRALFQLSEKGGAVSDVWRAEARASRGRFLERSCVRYVVVNRHRASPALREFATDVLDLVLVHRDADYELLVPANPPDCAPRRRRGRPFRDLLGPAMPASTRVP